MVDEVFDPFSAHVQNVSPEAFAQAGVCPVRHVHSAFRFPLISDPDYVRQSMFVDTDRWSVEHGSTAVDLPPELRTAMTSDGERHLWVRRLIQRGFSATELSRYEPVVAGLADRLIDEMLALPQRFGNFMALFAEPLPVQLMCLLLGVPEEDWQIHKRWADSYFFAMHNDPDFTPERNMASARIVGERLFPILAERRALMAERNLEPDMAHVGTILPNDFLSRFMCDNVADSLLDDTEILGLMLAFVLGGSETTSNLICNMLHRLLAEPVLWEQVKADPTLIESAIEESLRLDPPILGMFRTARVDSEVCGVTVPAGSKAMYNVSAVNRDAEIFDEPDRFRLDRPRERSRKHISFCGGSHLCLGAPLVRKEVKIIFERLIARLPDLDLDGPVVRAAGFNVWGKAVLPVRW